jgi:uncharacterized oxidoreductase
MRRIEAHRLDALSLAIAGARGSGEAEARAVAGHLVGANLAGHDSHGVGLLPDYVRLVREGLLVPEQQLRTVVDAGAVLVLDAGRGLGQAMAMEAMRRGIERARALGAAVVALRNSGHIGRVGHYAEACAAAGMATLHLVNVADHRPLVAPYAGADARFSTNPFCAAVPGADGPAVLLDMATSTIAYGKARVARNQGLPVPDGALIDVAGRPTTDPGALLDRHEGALTAFGLHKGSGLAVLCELLGGALTGGPTIQPENPRRGGIVNNMLSVVIDPAALGDPAAISAEVAAVKAWIKASPPAPGFSEVLLPGEPERAAMAERLAAGIPLDDRTLEEILVAGVALGLERAALERSLGLTR